MTDETEAIRRKMVEEINADGQLDVSGISEVLLRLERRLTRRSPGQPRSYLVWDGGWFVLENKSLNRADAGDVEVSGKQKR